MTTVEPWSEADVYTLRTLWKRGCSLHEIAAAVKRTPAAVQLKRRYIGLPGRTDRKPGTGRPVTVWTPERVAILQRDWPANVATDLVVAAINRLPGPPVDSKSVAGAANSKNLKRGPRQPAPRKQGPGRRAGKVSLIWSPQRVELLREIYARPIDITEIVARLNALPGREVEDNHCRQRAAALGLTRPRPATGRDAGRPMAVPEAPPQPAPIPATAPLPPASNGDPSLSVMQPVEPEEDPLPDIDPPPVTPVGPRRVVTTRDGAPSVASLMAASGHTPGDAEPITWPDALRWAQRNRVPLDGAPEEILRRINAARSPMPPWRIIRMRRPDDPLPPPWFGGRSPEPSKPTKDAS